MIISESDPTVIASLKQHLQSQFEMKDLGLLHYFLGVEVAYSSRAIYSHNRNLCPTFLSVLLSEILLFLIVHPSPLPWSRI